LKPIITGTGLWLLFLFFLPACEKPKSIGADIIPSDDLLSVQFTDTMEVEIESRISDSIRTDEEPINMFGNLIDPEFGRIRTSTFTNFKLAGSNLFLGDSLSLDSIVLKLELTGFYGNYSDVQQLEVLELDEKPIRENAYYNTDSLNCKSTNLIHPSRTSLKFNSDSEFKQTLTLRLSDALGLKILNATASELQNNENFNEFFKGLYLSTKPIAQTSREPGAVYYFKPEGTISGLYLYYNGKIGGVYSDTLSYRFQINEDAARFSKIERSDIQGRLIEQVGASPSLNPYLLLQAGIPVSLFVKFPNLHNLFPVAVNRAELEIPILTEFMGADAKYQAPTIIQGKISDVNGVSSETGFTSAIYDVDNKMYKVAVSSYSQQMINNPSLNYGFYLTSLNSSTNINRVVMGSRNHPTRRPRLLISYTSIPK
jgi:hypothetical protein